MGLFHFQPWQTGRVTWEDVCASALPGLLALIVGMWFAPRRAGRARPFLAMTGTIASGLMAAGLVLALWGVGGDHESPHYDLDAMMEASFALPVICPSIAWLISRALSKAELISSWLWGVVVMVAIDHFSDDGSEGAIALDGRWIAIFLIAGVLVAAGPAALVGLRALRR
jgi:hypothetical protein